jgi:predicted alpha/beta hydrolase family esterase
LLRYLAEEAIPGSLAGAFLLAAPSWDQDHWNFDDLKLPSDAAQRLAFVPEIAFYHCRDDKVVPFAHLALHARRIPQATARALPTGGHQFGSALKAIAADIQRNSAA